MFEHFPLWPDSASAISGNVDLFFAFLTLLSAGMTIAIFIAIAILVTKYRRRKGVEAQPIHGSTILELAWSIIPLIVFMAIFAWGAILFFEERTPPANSAEVYVVAKQWMWKLEHAEGQREINELHVPVGRDVKLIMTSQDVIHSFFIPAFRIKQDVLPGRYTTEWFRATKPGTYHLFCAEYCGTLHSGMIGQIVVMEKPDYEAWMAGGASWGSLAASGENLFTQLGCPACHRSDNQERGPSLMGLYGKPVQLEDGRTVTADENYLRESIVAPASKVVHGYKPVMPAFQSLVNEEQLNALVAYVKSLGPPAPPAGGVPGVSPVAAAQQPKE